MLVKAPLVVLGMLGPIGGLLLAGSITIGFDATNTEEFCISCHEMKTTVYQELLGSPHDVNSSGVRATCADCHVPRTFSGTVLAKLVAVKDVYHHLAGTVDTKEKFERRRLHMAQKVWASLEANDSRACRSCHKVAGMDFDAQPSRAARKHQQLIERGETCIDCHKGVVHALPLDFEDG